MFDVIEATVSAAVADGGTFDVGYPDNRDDGDYAGGYDHQLVAIGGLFKATEGKISLAFGATDITVTYNGSTTIPANTPIRLQVDRAGADDAIADELADPGKMARGELVIINLGAPLVADADSIIKAATSTELPDTETVTYTPDTDGTSPTDGVQGTVDIDGVTYWELDVPRNIASAVSHSSSVVAMSIVVTGKDVYRNDVVETIAVAATGTSQNDAGLKAFKYVRSIAITAAADAEANTLNLGFGDVLGLPVFLPAKGYVLGELEDGAAPTAGTLVAGVSTVASATTGDVRGTYDPNSAADGAKDFQLIAFLPDPSYKGVDQYGG